MIWVLGESLGQSCIVSLALTQRLSRNLDHLGPEILFRQSKISEVLGGSGYNSDRLSTPYIPQLTGMRAMGHIFSLLKNFIVTFQSKFLLCYDLKVFQKVKLMMVDSSLLSLCFIQLGFALKYSSIVFHLSLLILMYLLKE